MVTSVRKYTFPIYDCDFFWLKSNGWNVNQGLVILKL